MEIFLLFFHLCAAKTLESNINLRKFLLQLESHPPRQIGEGDKSGANAS